MKNFLSTNNENHDNCQTHAAIDPSQMPNIFSGTIKKTAASTYDSHFLEEAYMIKHSMVCMISVVLVAMVALLALPLRWIAHDIAFCNMLLGLSRELNSHKRP